MWPGPQDSEMGEFEAWTRLTTVRRLCGQVSMGPSGVPDQSLVLISLAISPPPINQSSGEDNSGSLLTGGTWSCGRQRVREEHTGAVHRGALYIDGNRPPS